MFEHMGRWLHLLELIERGTAENVELDLEYPGETG